MTLSAADFVPREPSPPVSATPRRIALLGIEDPPKEPTAMPKGVYTRKAEKEKSPKATKRSPRKARATAARVVNKAAESRCFALWNDGSIDLATPKCTGTLTREEAMALLAYVERMKAAK